MTYKTFNYERLCSRFLRAAFRICPLGVMLVLNGCGQMHDPLLHAPHIVEFQINVSSALNEDDLWQKDWRQLWQMQWPTSEKDLLGYYQPESYHLDIFSCLGNSSNSGNMGESGNSNTAGNSREKDLDQRHLLTSVDFMGNIYRTTLDVGNYPHLIYNNDNTYIDVIYSEDRSKVTLNTVHNPYGDGRQRSQDITYAPEQLYCISHDDLWVTDFLDDYQWRQELGSYVLTHYDVVKPCTYVYLIQVILHNNNGRIVSAGPMIVEGLSGSYEMVSNQRSNWAVAHQVATVFEKGRDIFGARLSTFGPTGEDINYISFRVDFNNRTTKTIVCEITSEMASLPTGGIITIELDVDQLQQEQPTTPDNPPTPPSSGDGIGVDIGGWDNENHAVYI